MRLAAALAAPSCRQTPLSCSRHRPSTCLWQSEPCSLEAICCALAPFATLAPPAVRRCQRAEAVRSLRATLARVGSGVLDGVPPRPPPRRPPSRRRQEKRGQESLLARPMAEAPTRKERSRSRFEGRVEKGRTIFERRRVAEPSSWASPRREPLVAATPTASTAQARAPRPPPDQAARRRRRL